MTGAAAAPHPLASRRARALAGFALALSALLAVYAPILRHLALHWWYVPDYNHGFLVAPLAAWFAWDRRAALRRAPIAGSWLGVLPLLAGAASLAIGRLGVELMSMRTGFVLAVIGLVLLVLGSRVTRILAFPLGFLFLMIPLPESLLRVVAFPLQLLSAKVAVASLHGLGIPALLEGNIIHLAQTELFVEQACSGIRSLMALVTLSVVFAAYFQRRPFERVVLVASTVPIAVAVNALRVTLTGLLAHGLGEETATGIVHDLEGVLTFGLALALLLAEAKLLERLARLPRRRRAPADDAEPGLAAEQTG